MAYLTWDIALSPVQVRRILKDPRHREFLFLFGRVLSRMPHYVVFKKYLSKAVFRKNFPRVKKIMYADPVGAGRVSFWQFYYDWMPPSEKPSTAAPKHQKCNGTRPKPRQQGKIGPC